MYEGVNKVPYTDSSFAALDVFADYTIVAAVESETMRALLSPTAEIVPADCRQSEPMDLVEPSELAAHAELPQPVIECHIGSTKKSSAVSSPVAESWQLMVVALMHYIDKLKDYIADSNTVYKPAPGDSCDLSCGDHTNAVGTITVEESTMFGPQAKNVNLNCVLIDQELLTVLATATTSNTFTIVERGMHGTQRAPHPYGALVKSVCATCFRPMCKHLPT